MWTVMEDSTVAPRNNWKDSWRHERGKNRSDRVVIDPLDAANIEPLDGEEGDEQFSIYDDFGPLPTDEK